MKTKRFWMASMRLVAASSLVGTTFGSGCLTRAFEGFNPCGTVLDCNPVEFDLLFRDITIPDFEECPISVFPTACSGGVYPPLNGGGGTGAGAGTGTGTGTPLIQNPVQNPVQNPFQNPF